MFRHISNIGNALRRAREDLTQIVGVVVGVVVGGVVGVVGGNFACPDAGLSARPGANFAQSLGFELVTWSSRDGGRCEWPSGNGRMGCPARRGQAKTAACAHAYAPRAGHR